MQYPIFDRLMQMQYLYLIGCSCILDWISFVNFISILDRLYIIILDWISFAAGANANAISILDRLYIIILDWISFAAGANANAISIYLIGYSYIY